MSEGHYEENPGALLFNREFHHRRAVQETNVNPMVSNPIHTKCESALIHDPPSFLCSRSHNESQAILSPAQPSASRLHLEAFEDVWLNLAAESQHKRP